MRTALLLVLALSLAAPAIADPGRNGRGPQRAGAPAAALRDTAGTVLGFDERERSLIVSSFDRHPDAVPARPLPPGIAKQVARGRPLPPGIARQAFPDALVSVLPARDPRHARILVGRDAVLIDISSGFVLDILAGVL